MDTPSIDPIRLRALDSRTPSASRPAERSEPQTSFESLLGQVRARLQDLEQKGSEVEGPRSSRELGGTLARVRTQYEDLMAIRSRLLEAYRLAGVKGAEAEPSDGARD